MSFTKQDLLDLLEQNKSELFAADNPFAQFTGMLAEAFDCSFDEAVVVSNGVLMDSGYWHVVPDGSSLRAVQVPTIAPLYSGTLSECQDFILNRI